MITGHGALPTTRYALLPTHSSSKPEIPCVPIIIINEFIIKTELPGLKAKDVEVTLDKDVLTIKGERKFSEEVKRENYHRIERRYGSFKRSFTLPSNVDLGSVKAGVKDGLLIVKIAKIEAPKPKVIEVEVEESKAKKIEAEEG